MPVDVSEATLRDAAAELSERYPALRVEALVGDFTLHLGHLPRRRPPHRRLPRRHHRQPLRRGAARPSSGRWPTRLEPGDWLLLGTDLVKSADRLIAAYDDRAGRHRARSSRNCLHVLNRELGADFDLDAFSYVPFWDPRQERMDLRLRAEMPQRVTIPGAGARRSTWRSGEEIRVEISTKFRPEGIRAELAAAGFAVERTWTDRDGDFALTAARREG